MAMVVEFNTQELVWRNVYHIGSTLTCPTRATSHNDVVNATGLMLTVLQHFADHELLLARLGVVTRGTEPTGCASCFR